jgi:hypothetical protein
MADRAVPPTNERRLIRQRADVFTDLAVCRRRLRFPAIFLGYAATSKRNKKQLLATGKLA